MESTDQIADKELREKTIWWPQFVDTCYPGSGISTESAYLLLSPFHKYLSEKLHPNAFEKVWPQNITAVIGNLGHPWHQNGFHPALVLHLNQFVNQRAEQFSKDDRHGEI